MPKNNHGQQELQLFNPISCHIKESPRAKHVRLKVSLYDATLTVTVPLGYNRRKIPAILEEKRHWIERTRAEVLRTRKHSGEANASLLPNTLELRAINEVWHLAYLHKEQPEASVYEIADFTLELQGPITDMDAVRAGLQRWLRAKAKAHLVPWLLFLSTEKEMALAAARVRTLKSCWASCSPRKKISLSSNLLFLPPALVEYILLHELCHTVHLNHSKSFWSLMYKHLPDYKTRDAQIRAAWRFIPSWSEAPNH